LANYASSTIIGPRFHHPLRENQRLLTCHDETSKDIIPKKKLFPTFNNKLLVAITSHAVSHNLNAWITDIMSLTKLNVCLGLNLRDVHRFVDTTVCTHLIVHPDPPAKYTKNFL
jgi:hypothetical protein